jgi:hypothetical protein
LVNQALVDPHADEAGRERTADFGEAFGRGHTVGVEGGCSCRYRRSRCRRSF